METSSERNAATRRIPPCLASPSASPVVAPSAADAQSVLDVAERPDVSEAADVLYHSLVGLLFRDVTLRDLQAEIARRFGVSGHDEKASRSK